MITGYDHLLFLAGVIFFLYRLNDIAKYVTLFAIGHSTTMVAGVYYNISISSFLIDAIIGLSVVYKALDNMGAYQRWLGFQPNTKAATLIFGLFHGFGLATKILQYQIAEDGLLANLLAFNVGVEFGQLLQQPESELGATLLTSAEHDRDLDLVAGLEEADDVALLGLVVVLVDLGAKLHLFDDGVSLVLAGLTVLHRRLVLELAVVHELGDRRARHRSNLDEIEVGLLGEPQGILDPDDSDLFAVRTDQSHLGDADPVVDAGFGADVHSFFGGQVFVMQDTHRQGQVEQ